MEVDDLILISVDDHLIEPPDVFLDHLPAKYQDRAPKLVRREDGADVWQFGGATIENAALNAVAGRPKEEYGLEPQSLEEVRPGCYDEEVVEEFRNFGPGDWYTDADLGLDCKMEEVHIEEEGSP